MSEISWIALTAIASWALVGVTWIFLNRQIIVSRKDSKVRLQIIYEEKFDSSAMIAERKKLAEQLLNNETHENIQEAVMNFYESVGTFFQRGYLDPEMAWSGFSFYAIRWWSATKDYIFEERRIQNNDPTIFEEFETLVDEFYKLEIAERHLSRAQLEPSPDDLKRFLGAEARL
jgi:hypothetical protein